LNKCTHALSDWTPSKDACFLSPPVPAASQSPRGSWGGDELDPSSCSSSLKNLHLRRRLPSEQSTLCCRWVLPPSVACFALRQRTHRPCWRGGCFSKAPFQLLNCEFYLLNHKNQAPIFPGLPGTDVPCVRSTLAVGGSIPAWLVGPAASPRAVGRGWSVRDARGTSALCGTGTAARCPVGARGAELGCWLQNGLVAKAQLRSGVEGSACSKGGLLSQAFGASSAAGLPPDPSQRAVSRATQHQVCPS